MTDQKSPGVLLLALMFMVLLPADLFAYIDPGTGSYVLQIMLAAVFGGLVALRVFWGKIKGLVRKSKEEEPENPE